MIRTFTCHPLKNHNGMSSKGQANPGLPKGAKTSGSFLDFLNQFFYNIEKIMADMQYATCEHTHMLVVYCFFLHNNAPTAKGDFL